jgi:hypothetical protein
MCDCPKVGCVQKNVQVAERGQKICKLPIALSFEKIKGTEAGGEEQPVAVYLP